MKATLGERIMKTEDNMMPSLPAKHGELAQYIFKNYESFFTDNERRAWSTIVEGRPCGGAELLSGGELEFYGKVTDRIMAEHPNEIILNRCPKCTALCRTPTACLCPNPDCNHTWFEERNNT